MILAKMAGLIKPVEDKVLEDQSEILEREAEVFRRAGGVYSTGEWLDMSPAEKGAAVKAGNLILAEQAALLLNAMHGDPEEISFQQAVARMDTLIASGGRTK